MSIDITITATCRPKILRQTLRSFCTNMFNAHKNIISNVFINIDPCGVSTQRDTLNVCMEFFKPSIITARMPNECSFPKAFIWTWQQALKTDSECVFHLEDDWELLRPIELTQLLILLCLYPDLSVLRLSSFRSGTHVMKVWDKLICWNGTFFEVQPRLRGLLGFCGHPSLIKKGFIQHVLPYLDNTKNPEKQIKGNHPQFGQYILNHRFGWYQFQDSIPTIRDIGRKWMLENGFRKSGSKAWFTQWEGSEGKKPKFETVPADEVIKCDDKPLANLRIVK